MGRRLIMVVSAAVVFLMLSSTAALAHICFNSSRSTQGTAGAAASPAWWSLEELIQELIALGELPPLCPDGVTHIVQEVDPDGTFATHANTILASGQFEHNPELSGNGKGIDHVVARPELIAAFETALGEALALCAAA